MDYDSYKLRINKINNIKNNILRFKWLIISILVLIIIAFSTYASLKGRVMHVSYSNTLTYGDNYTIECNNFFESSNTLEYAKEDEDEWTKDKPVLTGKYKFRVISNGLFKKRISKNYYFEIDKRELLIDVIDTEIIYGKTPTYETLGFVDGDNLTSLTFNYKDKTLSNTLVNLELDSVSIVNASGENVTACYEIHSNTTSGKEITFKPLQLIIEPVIEDKEYDGTPVSVSNTYTILNNKEVGYNDVISIETSFYKDDQEIDAPSVVGDYTLKINKYLINGGTNQNYNILTSYKNFSINKRNITIKTSDASKTYDGTDLSSNDYSIKEGSLVLDHSINIINNVDILNYGEIQNTLEAKILSNDEDVSKYYNISYDYGTLSILKKTINYTTASKEGTYDNTYLEAVELTSIDPLINDDTYKIIGSTKIIDAGEASNELELEIIDSLGNISYNYNLVETCGTLTIHKADVTIKPLDRASMPYIGEAYSNPKNESFEIISGKFYQDELKSVDLLYSSDIYDTALNASIYKVSIVRRDDLTNYNITYLDNTFEITKANVILKPVYSTSVFDYKSVEIDLNNFDVVSGTLYGNDKENINLVIDYYLNDQKQDNIYHAGEYKLVPIGFNSTNDLILNNYNISYENSTYLVKKKDVTISIKDQTVTYNNSEYEYDKTLESTDSKIIPSINNISSHASDVLKNAYEYALYIDSYEFIDTKDYVRNDFNITKDVSTFTIKPLDVEIKVANVEDTTYDGNIQTIDDTSFEVVSGTLYDDLIRVNIIDQSCKTIKNSDTYDLVISGYSYTDELVGKNYKITFSSTPYTYKINPKVVNITTNDETFEYDGLNHYPLTSFTTDIDLFNGDSITLDVNIENTLDSGKYEKEIEVIFSKGLEDSLETNYQFEHNTSYLEITKRKIVLTLPNVTQVYYASETLSEELKVISYHKENKNEFGIASIDSINYSTDYSLYELSNVGEYSLNITDYKILRDNDNIDITTLNYEVVELISSSLTILKRTITIKAIDKLDIIYSKKDVSYDDSTKYIIDYNNEVISSLPDKEEFKINSHFEQEGNTISAFNAGEYDVVIDSVDASEQVFANYDISYINGKYIILPKRVNAYIKEEIIYDALYHNASINNEVLYEDNDGFIDINGLTYEITSTEEYKNVGSYQFTFEINYLDGDILSNYNITYLESTLKIIPRDLILGLVETYYTYNDQYVTESSYDSNYLYLYDNNDSIELDSTNPMYKEVQGISLTIKFVGDKPKNVGDYLISVNSIGSLTDESLNKNYNIQQNNDLVLFHIVKRHLIATFDSLELEYDGKNKANLFNYTIINDNGKSVIRDSNTTGYSDVLIDKVLNDIEVINAGTYQRTLISYDFGNNLDVEFENLEQVYTINKRHIVIKPACYEDLTFENKVFTIANTWIYDETFDSNNQNYKLDRNIKVVVSEIDDKEIKNAGTYTIKISSYTDDDNYDIETTTNTITVKKRKQIIYTLDQNTIKYDALSHSYDGSYKTYDELSGTYYNNSLFDGIEASVKANFYKDGTLIGDTVKNSGTYNVLIDSVESALLDNFEIDYDEDKKTFTIEQHEIHVMYQNVTKDYDGISLDSRSKISSGLLLLNSIPDTISSYNATIRVSKNNLEVDKALNVGEYDIDITQIKLFTDSEEVSDNYKLVSNLGKHIINKRKLYIILDDTSFVYNGRVIDNKYSYYKLKDISGNEVELDELDVYVKYIKDSTYVEPLIIGEYEVVFDYYNTNELNELNNEFELKENAKLTITKANIDISFNTTHIDSIYGDNIDFNNYIKYESNTNDSYKFDFVFNVNGNTRINTLDVNSYLLNSDNLVSITSKVNNVELDNNYVSYNLENEVNINILPRKIEITFDDFEQVYDSKELDLSKLKYKISNLPDYEENLNISNLTYKDSTNSIVSPVHADSYKVFSINNLYSTYLSKDVSSNYNIDTINSNIKITPISISADILPINDSIEYDGLSHIINYKITPNNVLDGDNITFNTIYSEIKAGNYKEDIVIEDISSTNGSLISDYSIDYKVNYSIIRRKLSVTSASAKFIYDGEYHEYNEIASIKGLVSTDKIYYNGSSFIDSGTYKNELTYVITNSSGEDVKDCYDIEKSYGTITIEKRDISVYSIDETITYSGYKAYRRSKFILKVYDNDGNLKSFDIDSDNKTFNFGTIDFLSSIDSSKTDSIYESRKIYDNFEIIIERNGSIKTDNFNITYYSESYFEVLPYELDVNVISEFSKTYDGTEIDLNNLVELEAFDSYEPDSTIINFKNNESVDKIIYSGTYQFNLNSIRFIAYDLSRNEIDVSSSYDVNLVTTSSIVSISKEELTVKTDSFEYMWDGKDKRDKSIPQILKDNAPYNVPLGGKVTFSNQAVLNAYDNFNNKLLSNSITNSVELDIMLDGKSLIDNYDISYDFGKLSFVKEYSLNYSNDSTTYDGESHNVFTIPDGYTKIEGVNVLYNVSIDYYEYNGSKVNEIIYAGTYYLIPNLDSLVLTVNQINITYKEIVNSKISLSYNFEYVVKTKEILVQVEQQEKTYNGNYQIFTSIESGITYDKNYEIISGDKLIIYPNISLKDVGRVLKNIESYKIINSLGIDITSSYSLLNTSSDYSSRSKYQVKYEIAALKLEFSTSKSEFKYDGLKHSVEGLVISNLVSTHTYELVKESECGSHEPIIIKDESGNIVTNNYKMDKILVINRLTLSITTGSKSKTYDGTPLSCKEYYLNDSYEGEVMDGLRSGDYIVIEEWPSLNKVGTKTNRPRISIYDASGNDVTDIYEWKNYSNYGTLEITK